MDATRKEQEPAATDSLDRQRWAATAAFGLVLVGVTLLASAAHLLVVGALAGPVLVLPVIGLICLVTGLLAKRGTRAALVTALVVAVLVLLGNVGHLADTLGLPASPWDFIPNLAALIGLLVAIPGAAAGLRTRSTTDRLQHRVRLGSLVALVVGAVASLALSLVGGEALPPDAVAVTTEANAYAPNVVEVSAGDVLGVRNLDAYGHTFTVVDLDIDAGVAGGSTATIEVGPGTPPGRYEVTCVLHPEIMVATLVVSGS